jgi:2-C-methyl-D-erythritol 4-phosphate cytidylyltransferase
MNTAIIVAAGSGNRFGSKLPKQFVSLCGKPLIFHTIEKFQICSSVDEIILVLAEQRIEYFVKISKDKNFTKISKIVSGGKTRAESVLKGLEAISEKAEIVAVHDGARPLVSVEEISEIIELAKEKGAVCLVAPIAETIKQVEKGEITATIDRKTLRRALTPQAFKTEILKKAFSRAKLDENITDDSLLVELAGFNVFTFEGNPKNIKITTPEDLELAEFYLRKQAQIETFYQNRCSQK